MPAQTASRPRAARTSSSAFGILVVDRARARMFLCDDRRVREVSDGVFPVPSVLGESTQLTLRPAVQQDRDTEVLSYLWRIHASLAESVEPNLPIVLAGECGPLTAYRELFADSTRILASVPVGQAAMSPRGLHHQALRALGRSHRWS